MKTTSRLVFFVFIGLFPGGCSDDFAQSYASFYDLERLHNPRLQGWFPDILGSDGFDLREVHCIGPTPLKEAIKKSRKNLMDKLLRGFERWDTLNYDFAIRQGSDIFIV